MPVRLPHGMLLPVPRPVPLCAYAAHSALPQRLRDVGIHAVGAGMSQAAFRLFGAAQKDVGKKQLCHVLNFGRKINVGKKFHLLTVTANKG